ncbi:werner helicase interacting protein, putative [Entamoeba dispar SAW760]|uniref:Werner helicase interacting protein, putative n=1 Tax=Entamoeba dispar (strain ATCC PRA-260 / SAW760) TaxID=370354 RepID=B0EFR2_ENTDS|nr:werner helicase interacting protein, putative [Entamoeba dispar SAW760]EDR26634.1 werner helicase interacting protein, putative [Entamoeba dispar SAW760]|eukprot:EDR26634.1 werner helicase interacting protein, putative [Entamoeba dispar SAW760]
MKPMEQTSIYSFVKSKNLKAELSHTFGTLAERRRPQKIEEVVGQLKTRDDIIHQITVLGKIDSMIFFGPPGCGKTTLCKLIKGYFEKSFIELDGSSINTKMTKDLKSIIKKNKETTHSQTIIFIDEIHCISPIVQELLIDLLKEKTIHLIGTTTQVPSFCLSKELLLFVRVIMLERLSETSLKEIIKRAINAEYSKYIVSDEIINKIIDSSDGDGRMALNNLERLIQCAELEKVNEISIKFVHEIIGKKSLNYDKRGDEHYNLISAFQKSIRGSDEDASVYWLERMILSGEKLSYITRRMLRIASEDIGMADTSATTVISNVAYAVDVLGYPDCKCCLVEGVLYLARARKSNFLDVLDAAGRTSKKQKYSVPLEVSLMSKHCLFKSKKFSNNKNIFRPKPIMKEKQMLYSRFVRPVDYESILPTQPQH